MRRWLCGFLAWALLLGGGRSAEPVVNAEVVAGGLRIWIGGELFTEYVGGGVQRPFLYPLRGPSGESVVRPVPAEAVEEDHPHHRSCWFGHGSVNGVDFWTDGEGKGVQQHLDIQGIELSAGRAAFVAHTRWWDGRGRKVLRDRRRVVITAGEDGVRTLDFSITLLADQGRVVFGDTKEGSFAIRLCSSLGVDGGGSLLSSEGLKNGKVWGRKADWVACFGADPKGEAVTVTVLDHPQNVRHPTWWHARTYGLTAANPFGMHDFEKGKDTSAGAWVLEAGASLTLRYQVRIEPGEPNVERLKAAHHQFSRATP